MVQGVEKFQASIDNISEIEKKFTIDQINFSLFCPGKPPNKFY
jgi:hypothetical protein